jgi:hypothetical protein
MLDKPFSLQHGTLALVEQIANGARRQLVEEYGHSWSPADEESLNGIAHVVADMANGVADPLLYISTLPTGWGKTTSIVAAVREIVRDRSLRNVGVLIMVSTLAQIPDLVSRMGLREDQYAVRTGIDNEDLNNMGAVGLCKTQKCREAAHRTAQVMFTTRAKMRQSGASNSASAALG